MGSWDDDDNDDHVCAGVAAGVAELYRPVQHHALHLTHLTSEAADPRVEDELHLGPPRPRVAPVPLLLRYQVHGGHRGIGQMSPSLEALFKSQLSGSGPAAPPLAGLSAADMCKTSTTSSRGNCEDSTNFYFIIYTIIFVNFCM